MDGAPRKSKRYGQAPAQADAMDGALQRVEGNKATVGGGQRSSGQGITAPLSARRANPIHGAQNKIEEDTPYVTSPRPT